MTAPREDGRLTVALVSEVYWQPDGPGRLGERLGPQARRGGGPRALPARVRDPGGTAALFRRLRGAPVPAAAKAAINGTAEPMDGPRARAMASAAKGAGIGLV